MKELYVHPEALGTDWSGVPAAAGAPAPADIIDEAGLEAEYEHLMERIDDSDRVPNADNPSLFPVGNWFGFVFYHIF